MLTRIKDFRGVRNYSNFYTPIDVSSSLEILDDGGLLTEIGESVFGLEIDITTKGVSNYIVTPPHVRVNENTKAIRYLSIGERASYYDGYLLKPFFLPLYRGLDGRLLEALQRLPIQLSKGEGVTLQWLFKKAYKWKGRALEMYDSYLKGTEYPSVTKLGRKVQQKTLTTLNRLSSFHTERDPLPEAERKILSDGYHFQLLVAVTAVDKESEKYIVDKIRAMLNEYSSYNAIRVGKLRIKPNKGLELIQEGIIATNLGLDPSILSKGEIASLLGGDDTDEYVDLDFDSDSEEVSEKEIAYAGLEDNTIEEEIIIYKENENNIKRALELLPSIESSVVSVDEEIVTSVAEALKRVGIVDVARLYEASMVAGVRLTVIQFNIPKGKTLTDLQKKNKDIQAALGVPSLGVEQGDEPDTVKITIPNQNPAIIGLRGLLEREDFKEFRKENPLAFVVGVDEVNNPIYLSLAKLVHLLVAGTTGSGKSVFLNSIAVSLITSYDPRYLQMYMIDPKEVELQHYAKFPHVKEVVTDMDKAVKVLEGLTKEMDNRYTLFRENGVKNIEIFNAKVGKDEAIPYIVCVIDEYADLVDTHKGVEEFVGRLGQKARAAGIHLVLATQRPSVKVVSGRIKAVIPNAVSFNLSNNNNYKTVFGTGIPYSSLLGRGDGVMKIEGYPKEFQRFQSAIVSPDEMEEEKVFERLATHFIGAYSLPSYDIEEEEENTLVAPYKEESNPEPEPEHEHTPEKGEDVSSSLENGGVTPEEEEIDKETSEELYKLKQIIATTGETRTAHIRKALKVKTAKIPKLMGILVEEGWLVKLEGNKGYEIIASEDVMSEWKAK